jgi:hypothetical protein
MKIREFFGETEIPIDYATARWDIQLRVTLSGINSVCTILPGAYHLEYPFPCPIITVENMDTEQGKEF